MAYIRPDPLGERLEVVAGDREGEVVEPSLLRHSRREPVAELEVAERGQDLQVEHVCGVDVVGETAEQLGVGVAPDQCRVPQPGWVERLMFRAGTSTAGSRRPGSTGVSRR
jgi:hypothetical protein